MVGLLSNFRYRSAKTNYLSGDASVLANLLRSDVVLSPEIREFIAQVIEGKVKKKRGVKGESLGKKSVLHVLLKADVEEEMIRIKKEEPLATDVYRQACATVGKQWDLKEDAVDKRVNPNNRRTKKT